MIRKWWSKKTNKKNKNRSGRQMRPRSLYFRPYLEWLEARETPSTLTVTNTADSGAGSLRNALTSAASGDTINFNIGGGVQTISPATPLPTISVSITIDGTAPASHSSQIIEINGSGAGAGAVGLQVVSGGGGTTIEALVIGGFSGEGIELNAGGNTITGDFIGTDTTGATALANGKGIFSNSSNNTIGGTAAVGLAAGAGNLISGNTGDGIFIQGLSATGNTIEGNFIGTAKNGTSALANGGQGIHISLASSNTIGGTTAGARNVISGNTGNGIGLDGPSNLVEGNYVGTDLNGSSALPNVSSGFQITSANNTIGGTTAGSGNVISGNLDDGFNITQSGATGNVLQGNFIGTDKTGMVAIPNSNNPANPQGGAGVQLNNASNNLIGGTTSAARNIISGNTSPNTARGVWMDDGAAGNVVEGNYIGLNAAGTGSLPNDIGILIERGSILGSHNNTIGGAAAGAGNFISGNTGAGILITDSGTSSNLVQGNSIGINTAATPAALPNGTGVSIANSASNNTIGGTVAAASNVISGNTNSGVSISGAGTTGNLVENNNIGSNRAGTGKLANGTGISIFGGASGNSIGGSAAGTGNLISGNTGNGVLISGTGTNNNVIQSNVIGTNTTVTGALANQNGVDLQGGAQNNTIGGTTVSTGNIISGNTFEGVEIFGAGSSGNVVEGNFIGTDATGKTALANADGVFITAGAANNIVGGSVAGSGNLISGNTAGVNIFGTGTSGNQVLNNAIGLDITGAAALANHTGVIIHGGATGNTIGTTLAGFGNVISGNIGDGVQFIDAGTSGNRVEGNFIGTDSAGDKSVANSVGVAARTGAANNTIGGTASGAANLISGNSMVGVILVGAGVSGNVVQGNFIGTDTGGTKAVPNLQFGVQINGGATGNTIGGTTAGVSNVISGNKGDGIIIFDAGTNGNFVQGNFIGTQNDGTTPLPNTLDGVDVVSGAANNTIGGSILTGGGNIIGFNGGGGIFVQSAGTTNFSGANLNTNSTVIDASTLQLTTGNAIPATSAVIVNQGGTLDLNNNSDTIASLSDGAGGGGSVLLGNRTLTVGDSTNTTFSGTISGSGATGGTLIKVGSGTLTLKGTSTYLGTVIKSGTLLWDGVHSGTTTTDAVLAGVTLGGGGTAGFTTVNGTVSPGDNATGRLTTRGAIFKSGSSLAIELLNNAAVGTDYDQLAGISGSIDLGANAAMLDVTLLSGFTSNVGDVFDIVSNPAGVTGTFGGINGTVMPLTNGTAFAVGNTIFRINYTLTDVTLTHVAASTTTTLITSGSPSTVGFTVTFTATVAVVSPGTGTPTGSVTFMDGNASLGNRPLTNGTAMLSTSSLAIGTHMITVVYGATPTFGGSTSNTVTQTVVSGAADHFVVSAPTTTKAGAPFSFTVTAEDSFGNVSTTFADMVTVTTSDALGVIQTTPYTFTTGPGADNGVHTFTVTLKSAGLQSVTVTDSVTMGISATANVQVVATFGKDIVGRVSSTGQWFVGVSNGSSAFANTLFASWSPAVNWTDVVTGDFNGDGMTDIAGRDPSTGVWWVGLSNGSSFTTTAWTSWSTAVTWVDVRVGDFIGNGKMDIAGRVMQSGQWWVAQSTGSSFTNNLWDTWSPLVTWVNVNVGDFNGDGKADLTGRVLSDGTWWTGLSTGSSFNTSMWAMWNPAVTWVDVQVGDFNGDGKSDITGRFLQTGQWFTGLSNGSTAFDTSLWATWNPAVTWVDVKVGDFNGDGKADIVGRFLQTGQWFTGLSNGSGFTTTLWATWNPAVTWVDVQVGDFNADGKTDITGRFLQTGQWFTGLSNGSTAFTTTLWDTWNPNVTWVDVHAGNFA